MNIKTRRLLACLELMTAALFWGFAFVVVKDSVERIPVTYMVAFRFSIAAVLCALIFCRKLRDITPRHVLHGAILGALLFFGYYTQTLGCKYTTAGKNAFLTTTYVILIPLLNWLFTRKRPGIHVAGAAVTALVGIALLSLQGDLTVNKGDALTLLCGLGYAVHIILLSRYVKTESSSLLTVLQLFFTAVFAWIFAPFIEGPLHSGLITSSNMMAVLYLGIFSSMLSFLLQTNGQKYATPASTSLCLSMESVFGILFSCLILSEPFTIRIAFGCILIFVAVMWSETKFDFLRHSKKK